MFKCFFSSKILKIEGKLENNYNLLENLENSKRKSLVKIQSNLISNITSLENHQKKTDLISKEFQDLKDKLERQNKIYETEIIKKKQDNEKVNQNNFFLKWLKIYKNYLNKKHFQIKDRHF